MFLALIVYVTMVVLPALNVIGIFAVVLAITGTILTLMSWAAPFSQRDRDRGRERFLKWTKSGWLKICIALALLAVFTPNEKTSWYIVGAYAAEKVATADTTRELASGAYDIFRDLVKKAQENLGEVDGNAIREKAEQASKALDKASKTVDDALKKAKEQQQ